MILINVVVINTIVQQGILDQLEEENGDGKGKKSLVPERVVMGRCRATKVRYKP